MTVLRVDVKAVAYNADAVLAMATRRGWETWGVVKTGYSHPRLIRAFRDGGISSFALSSASICKSAALSDVPQDRLTLLSLPLPAQGRTIVRRLGASTHSSPLTIASFGRARSRAAATHNAFIAVRTAENREGIPVSSQGALEQIASQAKLAGMPILGVAANFGCVVEAIPNNHDLQNTISAQRVLSDIVGHDIAFSLGGSVLLRGLPELPGVGRRILRIGEAILTGTIPGVGPVAWLKRPFHLEAPILERVQPSEAASARVLVRCGATTMDSGDAAPDEPGLQIESMCSEYTSLSVCPAACFRIGKNLKFTLGYKSVSRALASPLARIQFV